MRKVGAEWANKFKLTRRLWWPCFRTTVCRKPSQHIELRGRWTTTAEDHISFHSHHWRTEIFRLQWAHAHGNWTWKKVTFSQSSVVTFFNSDAGCEHYSWWPGSAWLYALCCYCMIGWFDNCMNELVYWGNKCLVSVDPVRLLFSLLYQWYLPPCVIWH